MSEIGYLEIKLKEAIERIEETLNVITGMIICVKGMLEDYQDIKNINKDEKEENLNAKPV